MSPSQAEEPRMKSTFKFPVFYVFVRLWHPTAYVRGILNIYCIVFSTMCFGKIKRNCPAVAPSAPE